LIFFFYFTANDKDLKIEAVLDYIVERKRLDDLSKSIIDGRYNEQKVD
jgi:ERCC4-type nuclease